jgi:hypothetical protein
MQRISAFFAAAAVASLTLGGCFGDNAGEPNGNGSDEPGAPSIVEIAAPDEADIGDVIDLTVKVKGAANEQLSVAIDGTLGTFSPQNKVVIADDNGEGTFATRYAAGIAAGTDTIKANAASTNGTSSKNKTLIVHDVERFGNTTTISTTSKEVASYLIVYPLMTPRAGLLTKVGILAPEATTAWIGLYTSARDELQRDKPQTALFKVMVPLAVGVNEIQVPKTPVESGKYWVAVTYIDTPFVRKTSSASLQITGWNRTTHPFDLPDSLAAQADLMYSTTINQRNFYLVLRK